MRQCAFCADYIPFSTAPNQNALCGLLPLFLEASRCTEQKHA